MHTDEPGWFYINFQFLTVVLAGLVIMGVVLWSLKSSFLPTEHS